MAAHDSLHWTPEAEDAFIRIKQLLVSSSMLGLPDYSETFFQTVDCRNGFMTSVLTQMYGEKAHPVAFYSSKLDPVARALPPCVQAVVAASLAVQASASVVLFHHLVLRVPHTVSIILLQNKISYLSPSRHLSCMTTLLSQSHLEIERCTGLNPSTLMPNASEGSPDSCLDDIAENVLPRADLKDQPFAGLTLLCL